MVKYLREIEEAFSVFPKRTSAQHPETYIGGGQSQLRYLGLRGPDLHQVMKTGFSFSHLESYEIARIWDFIWWRSNCYEVMSLALAWFYSSQQQPDLKKYWPQLKKWSAKIDNWAHSDVLSGIYARALEDSPKDVYATLVQWNKSDRPWLRRLSIVSLLYYSSQRKKVLPFKKIVALVKPQLFFNHHYVQKGVGWTLRETWNIYPDLTFDFLEQHIHLLSSAAFSAATEKVPKRQKEYLKKIRKQKHRVS